MFCDETSNCLVCPLVLLLKVADKRESNSNFFTGLFYTESV